MVQTAMASSSRPHAVLINPPVYDFALYDLYLKPYGLLRIGRWLREAGYQVTHINALQYDEPETEQALGRVMRKRDGTGKFFRQHEPYPENLFSIPRSFARYGILREVFRKKLRSLPTPPDLILITTGMTYWYKGVQEAAGLCRELYPDVPLGVGGVYATLMEEHCRKAVSPDFITSGSIWPGIVPELEKRGLPVPGSPPPEEPDTDDPVWRGSGVLRLNEGCPFHCDYCASNLLSPSFCGGEASRAVQVLEKMVSRWGTRNFAFYDDALLVNKKKVFHPFLEEVIALDRNLKFYNPNALHIRYLDEETLRLMIRAGFQEIRLGFESADDTFHEQKDAKVTMDVFARAVDALKASGFPLNRAAVYILAGLPGQSREEVEQSIRYAARFGLRCRIAQYSPVPGTALWQESLKHSRFPLEEEPLYHNNTFFSMEWEGFTRQNLEDLKALTLSLYQKSSV